MNTRPIRSTAGSPSDVSVHMQFALLLLVAQLIAAYFVVRYSGRWVEIDTASLAEGIRAVESSGRLAPNVPGLYPNGFSYQVVALFVSGAIGVDVVAFQQLLAPFFLMLAVPLAWVLFREIAGTNALASLGVLFLLMQPEFLFVVLRGSHEKIGRLMMILSLFLLFRSFRHGSSWYRFSVHIVLFYVAVFALMASNVFLGTSFVAAIVFSACCGWLLERLSRDRSVPHLVVGKRLLLVMLVCIVMAALLVFYIYPPVQYTLAVVQQMSEQLKMLALGLEPPRNVYSAVLDAWQDPVVYYVVNLPNWGLLLVSFLCWSHEALRWLRGQAAPSDRYQWILWLLYGAFGVQAVLAVLSDLSGSFGNIQHRLFPSLSLIGIAVSLAYAKHRSSLISQMHGRAVRAVGAVVVGMMLLFAIIKATNEASIVNWWTLYSDAEWISMSWIDKRARYSEVWVGPNERLEVLWRLRLGESSNNNTWVPYAYRPTTAFVLMSDLTLQQLAHAKLTLPAIEAGYVIYDNGAATITRRRPNSEYQR